MGCLRRRGRKRGRHGTMAHGAIVVLTVFLATCTMWHLSPLKQSFWWKNLQQRASVQRRTGRAVVSASVEICPEKVHQNTTCREAAVIVCFARDPDQVAGTNNFIVLVSDNRMRASANTWDCDRKNQHHLGEKFGKREAALHQVENKEARPHQLAEPLLHLDNGNSHVCGWDELTTDSFSKGGKILLALNTSVTLHLLHSLRPASLPAPLLLVLIGVADQLMLLTCDARCGATTLTVLCNIAISKGNPTTAAVSPPSPPAWLLAWSSRSPLPLLMRHMLSTGSNCCPCWCAMQA